MKRMLEKVDIRVRTKVHKTLRQIHVKPKDQVLVRQQTGVVYRTLCKDYPRVYVGQTGRTLECRLKEHKKQQSKERLKHRWAVAWEDDHQVE